MNILMISPDDLQETLAPLVNAHFNEVDKRADGTMPNVQWESYKQSIINGTGFALGVYNDGAICVGYLTAVVLSHPHTGILTAIVDAFYILPEYRNRGVGSELIKHYEDIAKNVGCKHSMVSVKCGTDWRRLVSDQYVESDTVLFRSL